MLSPIAKEKSYLPSSKRQKVEETNCDDSSYDSDEYGTPEAMELFNQVLRKSGGFEIDFSKFGYTFDWNQLDLDDSTMVDEPQTNRDCIAMLSKRALSQHTAEQGEILRAKFHPSAGLTFYISFEVKDPSNGNQTKPYRAVVRHLAGDIEVGSCNPKLSSSS